MDDNVIRFPVERRREPPPPPVATIVDQHFIGTVVMNDPPPIPFECTDDIHNFDAVPGRCRCGERYWDPDDPDRIA